MTWEWSHTQEAYDYAREQLDKLPRETLLEIVEEWNDKLKGLERPARDENGSRIQPLDDATAEQDGFYLYSNESLATWIWECCSNWEIGRNCSNGGHELYLDPNGYHTVDLENMPKDWQPSDY